MPRHRRKIVCEDQSYHERGTERVRQFYFEVKKGDCKVLTPERDIDRCVEGHFLDSIAYILSKSVVDRKRKLYCIFYPIPVVPLRSP